MRLRGQDCFNEAVNKRLDFNLGEFGLSCRCPRCRHEAVCSSRLIVHSWISARLEPREAAPWRSIVNFSSGGSNRTFSAPVQLGMLVSDDPASSRQMGESNFFSAVALGMGDGVWLSSFP